jgi:hypothetical protein
MFVLSFYQKILDMILKDKPILFVTATTLGKILFLPRFTIS